MLCRGPLFLPKITGRVKLRVFAIVAEFLHEAVVDFQRAAVTQGTSSILLPSWFQIQSYHGFAMCEPCLGALRLAALLDVEALASVLMEQFLPPLIDVYPTHEDVLRSGVNNLVESLQMWVASPHQW